MPAAAATSPAAATLAALATFSALGAIAADLTRLSARLNVGPRLAACRRRCSAHRRLRGTLADIPIPRPPILIPVVLTPITIAPIPITAITAATTLRAPPVALTAALTTLAPARLAGMLPMAIATPFATAGRAMS